MPVTPTNPWYNHDHENTNEDNDKPADAPVNPLLGIGRGRTLTEV